MFVSKKFDNIEIQLLFFLSVLFIHFYLFSRLHFSSPSCCKLRIEASFSLSAGVAGCCGCVEQCTILIPLMTFQQFTLFFLSGTFYHGKQTLHVLNIASSTEFEQTGAAVESL